VTRILRPGGRSLARAGVDPHAVVSVYEIDPAELADEHGHRPSDRLLFSLPSPLALEIVAAVNAYRHLLRQVGL
jgi:hypothetical protein